MPHKDPKKRKSYHKSYSDKWYEKNRERVLAKEADRYRKDPEAREASRRRSREHYLRNKEKIRERNRQRGEPRSPEAKARRAEARKLRMRKYRADAIKRMGGCCETCGIDDEVVLQFDHRKPVRRGSGSKGFNVGMYSYREVLKLEKPESVFALLCANCHVRKTKLNGEYRGGAAMVARDSQVERIH